MSIRRKLAAPGRAALAGLGLLFAGTAEAQMTQALSVPDENVIALGRLIALAILTIFTLWGYGFHGRKKLLLLTPLLLACLAFDISTFQETAGLKPPAFGHLSAASLAFGAMILAGGSFLARRVLALNQFAPGLDRGLGGFEVVVIVAYLALPSVAREAAALSLLVLWIAVLLIGAGLLVYFMQRGSRQADIIMLGWMPVIAGALFGRATGGGGETASVIVAGLANTGFLLGLTYYLFMLSRREPDAVLRIQPQAPTLFLDQPEPPGLAEISPDRATGATLEWDVIARRARFSPAAMELLRLETAEIGSIPEDLIKRIHPIDREKLEQAVVAFLKRKSNSLNLDFRLNTRSENYRWIRVQASGFINPQGQMARCFATLVDITMEKIADARRMHNLVHDPITGLPNRALFLDRLARSVMDAKAKGGKGPPDPFAILLVDIDHFKAVNDILGFAGGDRVLAIVGQRVLSVCRPQDTVSRIGDDEFTVLLPGVKSGDDAILLAERLAKVLKKPITVGDKEVFVSVSIGVALLEDIDASPQELLVDAEIALYRAKQSGRGTFELYQPGMRHRPADMMALDADLRRALERDEIELFYQPIQHLPTGRLAGFEALLRWRHPKRGLIGPDSFIWLAEETGVISALGRFALEQAAGQLAHWQRDYATEPPLFVSVNVSTRQLVHRNLLEDVDAILERNSIAPRTLKLELTESQIMRDPATAVIVLEALRDRDIGLSLDDFGTGYSSLSHLRKFPFDTLKVDRSFVAAMEADQGTRTIVGSIIGLAHDLGLAVVAEGVETDEDNERLIALDCDYGQGYRVGKPMPLREADELVKEYRDTQNTKTAFPSNRSGHPAL